MAPAFFKSQLHAERVRVPQQSENSFRIYLALAPTRVPSLVRRDFLVGVLSGILAADCRSNSDANDAEETIGPLISPSALAARINDVTAGTMTVLYVGPNMLFGRGHIPGARNVGEARSEEGRRALSETLAKTPAETEIVVYCGCCPVRNCPNVRPASAAIRTVGRPNARVLDLPTKFATDWADKGYPVERSQP